MKKLQRFISAVLCIVMIAAMAVPMSASSLITSAAPTTATSSTSVREILKDFDKDDYAVVEFGKGGKPALAEYSGGTGVLAEHTVYDGVNATKLVAQDISWASFAKSHIAFGNNVPEFASYSYMVVKYASQSDKAYRLGIGGWGEGESVYFEVPAGKTGWTTSEVLTISPACAAVKTSKRSIVSSSSTAETYIGDIVFFKNLDDAEEYAKWAPIYLDPNGDVTIRRMQKKEENWETIKLIMMLIGSAIGERIAAKPYVPPLPFEGIDEEEYSVVSFGKGGNNYSFAVMDSEPTATATTYNGKECVKMLQWYPSPNYMHPNGSNYHMAFGISLSAFETDDLKYFVVEYASVADENHSIYLWEPVATHKVVDVKAGTTDWSVSGVNVVNEDIYNRLNMIGYNNNKISLASDAKSYDAEIYISQIVFFESRDLAKKYVEQYNNYYEAKRNSIVHPIAEVENGYTRFTFNKEYDGGEYQTVGQNFVYKSDWDVMKTAKYTYLPQSMPTGADMGSDYISYVDHNGLSCAKTVYHANNYANGGGDYGFCFYVNEAHKNYRDANREYAVITYATESTDPIEFALAWGLYSADGKMTNRHAVRGVTANPDGWMTTYFKLGGAWSNEGANAGREKLGIYSNDQFYIRELIFFETEADAKAYAEKAPFYFNGEEYDEDKVVLFDPINQFIGGHTQVAFAERYFAYYSTRNTADSKGAHYFPNSMANSDAASVAGNKEHPTYSINSLDYAIASMVDVSGWPEGLYAAQPTLKKHKAISYSINNMGQYWRAYNAANFKYMVVTYDSYSTEEHVLFDWRTQLTIEVDANTKGWRSDVVTLPDPLPQVPGTKWCLGSTAPDGYLHVRELVFFRTEQDAKDYAKLAPAYCNEIESKDPLYNLQVNGEGEMFVTSFAHENVGYSVKGDYSVHSDATYGRKGTPCVEITSTKVDVPAGTMNWNAGKGGYLSFTDTNGSYGTKFADGTYKYAVVTYATENQTPVRLSIHTWANDPNNMITLAEDISISDGKWVTSGIIETDAQWATVGDYKMQFCVDSATHDPIYINSIIFFSNRNDAEKYVKLVPEYYNGEEITDLGYWFSVLAEGEVYTTTFAEESVDYVNGGDFSVYSDSAFGKRNVPCVEIKSEQVEGKKSFNVGKGGHLSFAALNTAYGTLFADGTYKYAVATYATKEKTAANLRLYTWGAANTVDKPTFASDISVSGGKWVTSDIVEIDPSWGAGASAKKMQFFTDASAHEPIYIREIRFFESLADAEYYQENAPEYYNNQYAN